MNTDWKFEDPPNAASLTTTFVLDGAPILRVFHDFDGGWQFHGSPDDPVTQDVAKVVSLQSMVSQDSTITELHDLPYGWRADRQSVSDNWIREKNNPFPTYAEDGYYLEDAVLMSHYRDDIHPPPEEISENLQSGTYVKLLFRFAAEDSERMDGETERMWVQIKGVDEDENYVGILENDPLHSESLSHGEAIAFHPLHVAEILDEDGA